MPSNLSLFYYYRKHVGDLSAISAVEVSSDADVDHCKRLILQEVRSQSPMIDADLYMFPPEHSVPMDSGDPGITFGKLSISDLGEPLSPLRSLQSIFEEQPKNDRLHLVMVDRGIPLRVTFWVPSAGQIFDAKVKQGDTPEFILRRIKETIRTLGEYMVLFKTSYKKRGGATPATVTEGQPLPEDVDLFTAFNDLAFAEFPCIRVAFQERKHHLTWDLVERATKRRKLDDKEDYRSLQASSSERLLDYHEHEDHPDKFLEKDLPPIEVLFDGFGKFLDVWRAAYTSNCGAPNFSKKIKIDRFVDAMSKVHPNDHSRCWDALDILNSIFPCTVAHDLIRSSKATLPSTGGHSTMGRRASPCIVVVCRNKSANSIPAVELAGYYSRIVKETAENSPGAVKGSILPSLGITIIGSTITFFGLAHVGSVIYVPLTTSFWCLPVECGGSDYRQLYTAFNAAFVLLASIEEEGKRLNDYLCPPAPIERPFYPQINRLARYPDFSSSIDLQITGFVVKDLSRNVYTASSSSGKLILKLTRSYSAELHAFCADLGRAPKLLAFERLPGGIFAVAMEYLAGQTLGSIWPTISYQRREEWICELQETIEKMHEAGYVHGDLREPNIWCLDDRIVLLDFDWGGKVGEACYPTPYLHPQLTNGRDMSSLEITKEDDDRVFRGILKGIGEPEVSISSSEE